MNIVSQDLSSRLAPDMRRIAEGRHHDPFAVLGYHRHGETAYVLVYLPHVRSVRLDALQEELSRIDGSDFFIWQGQAGQFSLPYRLAWIDEAGNEHCRHDPYSCDKVLPDYDIDLFKVGKHKHCYRHLGAHVKQLGELRGVLFATWAPNAERVSVVGDFNRWDGRVHPMRSRGLSGIWEIFIPDIGAGSLYKFEIRNRNSGQVMLKADPYAQQFEVRPSTASVVPSAQAYDWGDQQWLAQRQTHDWQHAPLSVYEVHLGSWQRDEDGNFLNYRELAHRLVDYCQEMGFNALELLPVNEHPFDGSWGYQTLGYFAPTSRFGTPDDFRYFVDYCHQHGLRIFLDWVPGHFPKDAHGLARFDGSALYEHEDVRKGEHRDWGTLIFNYGRAEVKGFLIASAVYWLEEFHIDGLRVDAVASMLYLDYSRQPDDWVPNMYGGNENLEAIEFLRELNTVTQGDFPGTLMVAEESTSWPQVTRPTWVGGLGFSMKWNMGWMHDSLTYMSKDPIYRHYYHDQLTFGLLYAFSENFVLPFSHDEVVHGKASMLYKMPGDEWQRFANLRLLYTYMFTYPGKKLLFMGSEFGQGSEWTETRALDWYVLQYPLHQGVKTLVRDLNQLYSSEPALHRFDFHDHGFEWIDCHDAEQSVISYVRKGHDGEWLVIVLNFTPMPRHDYLIGVPQGGTYTERFNSDSEFYGGSNLGNPPEIEATATPWMGRPHRLQLTLPPLGGLILQHRQ